MIGTLQDVLNCDKQGVTNFTVDGKCSGCGQCCSDLLPIADEEIGRIRRYVREHNVGMHRNTVLAVGFDLTCPFRDEVKRQCAIYAVRPAICREFKCDQTPEHLAANKEFFHCRYRVVSMRQAFFGDAAAIRALKACLKG